MISTETSSTPVCFMSAAKMSCVIGRRVSTPCTLRWISAISFIAMITGNTRPFSLSRRYIWHSALWSLCTMRKSSTSFMAMGPEYSGRSLSPTGGGRLRAVAGGDSMVPGVPRLARASPGAPAGLAASNAMKGTTP